MGKKDAASNEGGGMRETFVKLRSKDDNEGKNERKVVREESVRVLCRSFNTFIEGNKGSDPAVSRMAEFILFRALSV